MTIAQPKRNLNEKDELIKLMKHFPYLPQKLFVLLIGVAVTEFGSQLLLLSMWEQTHL